MDIGQMRLIPCDPVDIILKVLNYEDVAKGRYSMNGSSTFDVMWIVEKDMDSLQKTLLEVFHLLPPYIPKMLILADSQEKISVAIMRDNYGLTVFKEHSMTKGDLIDKDRKEILEKSLILIKNPELGLSQEFVRKNALKGHGIYWILGISSILVIAGVVICKDKLTGLFSPKKPGK